jgi:hypothetical protein
MEIEVFDGRTGDKEILQKVHLMNNCAHRHIHDQLVDTANEA